MDDIVVADDALIGELGGGFPILELAVDRVIVAHLAEALGSMDALRDLTLHHVKVRHQFGCAYRKFSSCAASYGLTSKSRARKRDRWSITRH